MKLIEHNTSTVIDDKIEGDQQEKSVACCCSPCSSPASAAGAAPPTSFQHPSCSFFMPSADQSSCQNCPLIIRPPLFSAASSSLSSSGSNSMHRQCRICLLDTDTRRRPLITPCRCAGTVQHVHRHCLAHWIEVSSRKSTAVPRCELCGYRYRRNAFIDIAHVHFPFMELSDKVLNTICMLLLAIMGICAWVAVYHLSMVEQQRMAMASVTAVGNRLSVSTVNTRASSSSSSSASSTVSLSAIRTVALSEQPDLTELIGKTDQKFLLLIAAAVLFFCAFFLALFTQYRAEVTIFRAITRFWATNRNWRIRNYSPNMDMVQQQRRRRALLLQQQQRQRLMSGGGSDGATTIATTTTTATSTGTTTATTTTVATSTGTTTAPAATKRTATSAGTIIATTTTTPAATKTMATIRGTTTATTTTPAATKTTATSTGTTIAATTTPAATKTMATIRGTTTTTTTTPAATKTTATSTGTTIAATATSTDIIINSNNKSSSNDGTVADVVRPSAGVSNLDIVEAGNQSANHSAILSSSASSPAAEVPPVKIVVMLDNLTTLNNAGK